jgi:hypothetical protein
MDRGHFPCTAGGAACLIPGILCFPFLFSPISETLHLEVRIPLREKEKEK